MNLFRRMMGFVVAGLMAACGGGGSDPYPPTDDGGDTTSTAASVEVLSSANSVGTGGDTVTVTAVVKDKKNNGLAGTAVAFETDTGTLTSVSAKTDDTGTATATFAAGSDKSNRTAAVTVSSGKVRGSVAVSIEGTKLTYSGVTTLALGGESSLTVTATDSKGNSISNLPVTVSSSLDNGLSANSGTTDSNGQWSVDYDATNSGTDKLVFEGAGAKASASILVSGEDFLFTSPTASSSVTLNTAKTLKVRYRKDGVAQSGKRVRFSATIGTLSASSATTNASGEATVSITSDFAGTSVISAALSDGSAAATLPLRFVAKTPSKLELQVSPTAIGPNASGSSSNQARVQARVTDSGDNPVSNVTVNFSQRKDLSGGRLSQASAVTDENGIAAVSYIAGPNSTASRDVVIRGTVASRTSVFDDASMTVSQSALFIALGTSNVISNLNEETYKKDWTVYVTDSNGVPVSGVTITAKVLPEQYRKGSLAYVEDPGVWAYASSIATCPNEDSNRNGILDANENDGAGGSAPLDNGDGLLWPGNVVSVTPGNLTTDANGRGTLSLYYAESYAPWVQVTLEVQAIVSGTETTTRAKFWINGLADDFTDQSVPPAGVNSPFGTSATCTSSD